MKAKMELASGALVLSNRYSLAFDGGTADAWPWLGDGTGHQGETGDYQKGAFWYDTAHGELKFLSQWTEYPVNGQWALHANVVTAQP